MISLAERCEAARLPNKALNREVARAVGWGYQTPSEARRSNPAWFHPSDCRDGKPVIDSLHGTDVWREPLDYLGSLDAAMTLVPTTEDGWGWAIRYYSELSRKAYAEVWIRDDADPETGDYLKSTGATPALALCAASLRARALSTVGEGGDGHDR